MEDSLIFNLSHIVEKSIGSNETYSFDMPVKYSDINLTSNVVGKVEIMKTEEGFNAKVLDTETNVQLICERCLKEFKQNVQIDEAERLFLMKAPRKTEDPCDLYLVDTKYLTIDLSEMIRQEIILHFPAIPVCSSGCQGICPYCGVNRNHQPCDCKPDEADENKPLSALKDLLK